MFPPSPEGKGVRGMGPMPRWLAMVGIMGVVRE